MIKEIQMEAVFIGEKNVITKNVNLSKTWPLFTLILPKYVNISPFYKYKWKNADNFFKKSHFQNTRKLQLQVSYTYIPLGHAPTKRDRRSRFMNVDLAEYRDRKAK